MVACSRCGTPSGTADVPLGWMTQTDPGQPQTQYCEACSREHLRAIEGKLDVEYW